MITCDRPPVAFVAWAPVAGRSQDVADALGGVAWCDFDERWRGWRAPLRYARSTVRQARWLARSRPLAVIATNPPVFCGLGAWAQARATGVPFVLDSHPLAFEDSRSWLTVVLRPLHRFLVRRAGAALVTTEVLAAQVEAWGGRPLVLHEPPADLQIEPRPERCRPLVAFVGTFATDEPVEEVVAAARGLRDVDVAVTGVLERAPAAMVDGAPANVIFTGWLEPQAYRDLLRDATIVIALTTRTTSVMRAAYEAVYAGRPLIVSDTPVLRELFPDAVAVPNEADALVTAVRDVLHELRSHDRRASGARARQLDRWEAQLAALRAVLGSARDGRPGGGWDQPARSVP